AAAPVPRTRAAVHARQGQDAWFALAVAPDDTHAADRAFWAGDSPTGKIWRFRIDGPGTPETGRNTNTPPVGGLCINAEPTQGQYTQILTFSPATLSATAIFGQGNPVEEHQFRIVFNSLTTPLRVAVSAREVLSDGVCGANPPTDVDCGFVTFFGTDPALPQGVPYVHGRAAYYYSEALRALASTEVPTVSLSSVHDASALIQTQGA